MGETKYPKEGIRSAIEYARGVARKSSHCAAVADCGHCNLNFLATWAETLLSEHEFHATALAEKDAEFERLKEDMADYQGRLWCALGQPLNIEFIAAAKQQHAELATLKAERDRLKEAILWADGQGDDFHERKPGQGAYWWRTELMQRAALSATAPSAPAQTGTYFEPCDPTGATCSAQQGHSGPHMRLISAPAQDWACETCGARFAEYVNGCPHCWNNGEVRSGVRHCGAPAQTEKL